MKLQLNEIVDNFSKFSPMLLCLELNKSWWINLNFQIFRAHLYQAKWYIRIWIDYNGTSNEEIGQSRIS